MSNFRKVLLAAAAAGLVLVGNASAQTNAPSCTVPATNPIAYVAVEGTTELLAQLTVNCTFGAAYNGPVNFTMTAQGASFANQLKTGSTTAVDATAADNNGDPAGSVGVPAVANAITASWSSVTLNSAGSVNFTVSGLRVNASSLPSGSTLSIAVTSTIAVMGTPSSWTAAFVGTTIKSATVNSGTILQPLNYSLCTSGIGSGTSSTPNTNAWGASNVTVTAGFPDSFKSIADYSGTTNGSFGSNPATKAPLTGTVLAVTFNGLNAAGVNYYVPTVIAGTNVVLTAYTSAPTTGSTAASSIAAGATLTSLQNYWTTSTTQIGGAATVVGPYVVGGVSQYATDNGLGAPATPGAVLLTPTSGSATIYYAVSGSNAGPNQSVIIALAQAVPIGSAVTSFNSSAISVSVVPVGQASPAYPGISSTASATTGTASTSNANNGILSACGTTLLFPYVVNANGFDTGITITNASSGTGIAGNAGSCSLNYYGTGGATTTPGTTGSLAAGGQYSGVLSALNAGLTGYIVASCNFLGAHGYAFIVSGADFNGVAANYLAPILNTNGTTYSGGGGTAATPF